MKTIKNLIYLSLSVLLISITAIFTAGCDNVNGAEHTSKKEVSTEETVKEIKADENIKTMAYYLLPEELSARGHKSLLQSKVIENVLKYENEDDTTTTYMFSAPVEESGNKIKELTDGTYMKQGYGYIANGQYISKLFPSVWSDSVALKASAGSNFIEIMPADNRQYTSQMKENVNIFGQLKESVIYPGVFGEGYDMYCYATSFGFNIELVIPERTQSNTFKIKIKIPNLLPDTGSPDYILFKPSLDKYTVNSILYAPLAADSDKNWCYANSVSLVEKDTQTNTYTVEYTVNGEFLTDENTTYPITLNQSVHLYKSKQPDTSAYSDTGDIAGHYLSPYILLGDSTIKGEGWTYVRFDSLEKLKISPEDVVSVSYNFRNLCNLPGEAEIGAYAVGADWCSINTRWFNRPEYDEVPLSRVTVKERGDYCLDITGLFIEWMKNADNKSARYCVQNGFMIRCDTKDTNILLSSGDNGLFTPYLDIKVKQSK